MKPQKGCSTELTLPVLLAVVYKSIEGSGVHYTLATNF